MVSRSRLSSAFERASTDSKITSPDFSASTQSPAENRALAALKELIFAGDHRLDPLLGAIAVMARQLTGASGAALAMWKDGAMVCRARSGDPAPPIGARLSADTGISGECLRSGEIQHCMDTENNPLVDVEVCRTLGLRSMVVLPILGWRGVNGILEVFSTEPAAFSDEHIGTLQQLASLAERARASQPHGASPLPPRPPSAMVKPRAAGMLPASDRVGDVAFAFVERRSRPFVVGAVGLLAASLLAAVIWLGWRGPDDGKARAAAAGAPIPQESTPPAGQSVNARLPQDDPVWKAHPGGESLFSSNGKPAAGAPVQFASKVEILSKRPAAAHSPLLGDVARKVATDVAAPRRGNDTLFNYPSSVSPGVSGGELIQRVAPDYPAQARSSGLEGTVVLSATVTTDGSVRDVKVVQGSLELAASAVAAVQQWRYRPFTRDGTPVNNSIQINVDFKLPPETSQR